MFEGLEWRAIGFPQVEIAVAQRLVGEAVVQRSPARPDMFHLEFAVMEHGGKIDHPPGVGALVFALLPQEVFLDVVAGRFCDAALPFPQAKEAITVPLRAGDCARHGRTGVEPSYLLVRDIAPAVFELAGATPKDPKTFKGKKVIPVQGISFASRIMPSPPPRKISPDFDAGERFGRRHVRQGRWKALHNPQPYGTGKWELFDMEQDPGETNNLAAEHPDIVECLVIAWNEYATQKGVVLPVVPGN